MNDKHSEDESRDDAQQTPSGASDPTKLPHAGLLGPDGKPIPVTKNAHDAQSNDTKITKAASDISKWVVIWAAVTAFATISQAGIAWYSNYIANKSLTNQFNEMKSVADRIEGAAKNFAGNAANINQGVGKATEKLSVQADRLSENATQTSRLADNTARANANVVEADRPWMGAALETISFTVNEKPTFRIQFINAGKRPAIVDRGISAAGTQQSVGEDADGILDGAPRSSEDVSKSFIIPGLAYRANASSSVVLTEDIMGELNKRTTRYFVFGRINYRDPRTNERHVTRACFVYNPLRASQPDHGFDSCEHYNNAN